MVKTNGKFERCGINLRRIIELIVGVFPPQACGSGGLGPGQCLGRRPAGEVHPHPRGGSQRRKDVQAEARLSVRQGVRGVRSQPAGVAV